jgi:hypothetical protein
MNSTTELPSNLPKGKSKESLKQVNRILNINDSFVPFNDFTYLHLKLLGGIILETRTADTDKFELLLNGYW